MARSLDTVFRVVQIIVFMDTSVNSLVQITVRFLCAIKMAHVMHLVRQISVRNAILGSMVTYVRNLVLNIVRITCVTKMDHVRGNVILDILVTDVNNHV